MAQSNQAAGMIKICYNNHMSNNHVIQPLLGLIRSGKPQLRINDLKQVRQKIQNARAAKLKNPDPYQAGSVYIERKYLQIINELIAGINTPTITPAELVRRTSEIIQKKGFSYITNQHEAAHDNSYFPQLGQKSPAHKPQENFSEAYDIAFYHPMSQKSRKAHHFFQPEPYSRKKPLPSVFYMRVEEYGNPERVLIGNIQVDDKDRNSWKNQLVGQIMLMKKNLNSMMIQQAIRHAWAAGKREIVFQGGDAALCSQGLTLYGVPVSVMITSENIKKHERIYEAAVKEFSEIPVGHVTETGAIVYARDENKVHLAEPGNYYFGLLNYLEKYDFAVKNKVAATIRKLYAAYSREPGNLKQQIRIINKIFNDTHLFAEKDSIKDNAAQHDKKLSTLAGLLQNYTGRKLDKSSYLEMLDTFLVSFGYKEKLTASAWLHTTNIPHQSHHPGELYVDSRYERVHIYHKKDFIHRPQLGRRHYLFSYNFQNFNQLSHDIRNYKIWNYYENIIPKVLKKLKLKYERNVLVRWRYAGPGKRPKVQTTGWKITAGLEELNSQPVISFANNQELVLDGSSLPELQAAAQKFGLTAKELHIANDWIIHQAQKYSGLYHADQDRIYLQKPNLAALAHEGTHRLVAQRLIPQREYRALIRAGRRLVAADPKLKKRLAGKTPAGKLIYPPGKVRQQEYAALWVEHFYEKNKIARKYLAGDRVPITEKIVNYARAAKNTLLAYFTNNNEAIAANFLRQIERGYYNSKNEPAKAKTYSRTTPAPLSIN